MKGALAETFASDLCNRAIATVDLHGGTLGVSKLAMTGDVEWFAAWVAEDPQSGFGVIRGRGEHSATKALDMAQVGTWARWIDGEAVTKEEWAQLKAALLSSLTYHK